MPHTSCEASQDVITNTDDCFGARLPLTWSVCIVATGTYAHVRTSQELVLICQRATGDCGGIFGAPNTLCQKPIVQAKE